MTGYRHRGWQVEFLLQLNRAFWFPVTRFWANKLRSWGRQPLFSWCVRGRKKGNSLAGCTDEHSSSWSLELSHRKRRRGYDTITFLHVLPESIWCHGHCCASWGLLGRPHFAALVGHGVGGHRIEWSKVVAWMKIDDYSWETAYDQQIFIQHQGAINGGRIGAFRFESSVFLFQKCKHIKVMEYLVLLLLDVIK